jgi:DNA-binding transcriptional LysR family regulator
VRGVEDSPETQVRLVPVWQDALVVALSAGHPAAAADAVDLRDLAGLPLSLTARRNNPPLVDLVVGACRDAGFEPVPGPSHTTLQDTLAAFGAGMPGWTVLYAAHARQLASGSVRFLPVRRSDGGGVDRMEGVRAEGVRAEMLRAEGAGLLMTTLLAVRRDASAERLKPLFGACRAAARDDLVS